MSKKKNFFFLVLFLNVSNPMKHLHITHNKYFFVLVIFTHTHHTHHLLICGSVNQAMTRCCKELFVRRLWQPKGAHFHVRKAKRRTPTVRGQLSRCCHCMTLVLHLDIVVHQNASWEKVSSAVTNFYLVPHAQNREFLFLWVFAEIFVSATSTEKKKFPFLVIVFKTNICL